MLTAAYMINALANGAKSALFEVLGARAAVTLRVRAFGNIVKQVRVCCACGACGVCGKI